MAETESTLWAEAQIVNEKRMVPQVEIMSSLSNPGGWCFVNGSWKDNIFFSEQGWYSTLEGFDGLLEGEECPG